MTDNKKCLIAINKLCYNYGTAKVLEDINLNIHENKFYGVIGPNGSGKTTLIRNLSRGLFPQKGTIYLDGCDITDTSNRELARRISYVPQNTHIEFEFSVMDIILMGRSPYLKRLQSESKKDIDIVKNAMVITNTWQLRNKNIGEISGGERQRVIIARALSQQAKIMLLDEPVSQLDIHHQIEILRIIKKLTEEKRLTAILSLHDLNLAAQYSDQLILLKKGRVFKQGSPQDVITEENIKEAYGIKIRVIEDFTTGKPHIIPYY
jgi:iron complex transport system ATP-binding protein